jgi:hypothetical protein
MSAEEVEALLVEMEPEIRAADMDRREIEILEQKGVTAAGKLARKSCTSVFTAVCVSNGTGALWENDV